MPRKPSTPQSSSTPNWTLLGILTILAIVAIVAMMRPDVVQFNGPKGIGGEAKRYEPAK